MRRTRLIIDIFLAIALICFVFSLAYLINGSLEMVATVEQQEKARLAALFVSIVFAVIGIALFLLRLRINRKLDKK